MKGDPKQPKAYAVCRKGYWKTIVVFFDKAQALASIKGKESYLEVREVIKI